MKQACLKSLYFVQLFHSSVFVYFAEWTCNFGIYTFVSRNHGSPLWQCGKSYHEMNVIDLFQISLLNKRSILVLFGILCGFLIICIHLKLQCELDIMFHLEKAHFMLEEMVMNGCVVETSKSNILAPIQLMDKTSWKFAEFENRYSFDFLCSLLYNKLRALYWVIVNGICVWCVDLGVVWCFGWVKIIWFW